MQSLSVDLSRRSPCLACHLSWPCCMAPASSFPWKWDPTRRCSPRDSRCTPWLAKNSESKLRLPDNLQQQITNRKSTTPKLCKAEKTRETQRPSAVAVEFCGHRAAWQALLSSWESPGARPSTAVHLPVNLVLFCIQINVPMQGCSFAGTANEDPSTCWVLIHGPFGNSHMAEAGSPCDLGSPRCPSAQVQPWSVQAAKPKLMATACSSKACSRSQQVGTSLLYNAKTLVKREIQHKASFFHVPTRLFSLYSYTVSMETHGQETIHVHRRDRQIYLRLHKPAEP